MTDEQRKDADADLVAVSADLNRAGDTPVVALGIIEQIRGGRSACSSWDRIFQKRPYLPVHTSIKACPIGIGAARWRINERRLGSGDWTRNS